MQHVSLKINKEEVVEEDIQREWEEDIKVNQMDREQQVFINLRCRARSTKFVNLIASLVDASHSRVISSIHQEVKWSNQIRQTKCMVKVTKTISNFKDSNLTKTTSTKDRTKTSNFKARI